MANLKIAVAAVAAVAGLATLLVSQQNAIKNLRAQNASLRQQSAGENEEAQRAPSPVDNSELERLRHQAAEVLRLRAEVARLRGEKAESDQLRAENTRLREAAIQAAAASREQPKTENVAAAEFRQQSVLRLNEAKQWALAFVLFADGNAGQLPQSLAQAKTMFQSDQARMNLLDETRFEIVTTGRLDDVRNPSRTILLREKEPRQTADGKLAKAYAFADGHAEIIAAPDGDFAQVERARGLSSGPE